MSDVAARANASLKSVSRVVNDEPHVSPDLAGRIRAAIDELGYRPDRRARDLATRPAARLIGFVQVDAANPFFAAVYRGLEDVVRPAGMMILTGSTDAEPDRERELLTSLIEFRVDGLVIAAAEGSDELLRREISHGTPLVCIDRVLDDADVDTVVSDNRASTRRAVEYLLARRHRHIAFLGGDQQVWTAEQRHAGYLDAMTAAGLPPRSVVDVGSVSRAHEATLGLLDEPQPPTALFTAQDRITTGAIMALHERSRQEEVALFGFDEIPFPDQLTPTVSVVAQDPYALGRRAGELLLRRIRTPDAPPVFDQLDVRLVHRASGDLAPG